MSLALSAAIRNSDRIHDRHHVKLDYFRFASAIYDPATSTVDSDPQVCTVRAQVEGAEALRFLTNIPEAIVQGFTRLASVPAADFKIGETSFIPAVEDRIEWPAASVRGDGPFQSYRVIQIFPRIIDNTAVSFLLSLRDA